MALAVTALAAVYRGPYLTQVNIPKEQPFQFSHRQHVSGVGIDCRYCHSSVEDSSFAGVPPTETCMSCHSQVWPDAPFLADVRQSWDTGKPLTWTRLNDLPDFVYFDHSIHVAKGVGCDTCHGPVDEMAVMYKAETLNMAWCLDCHRAPEKYLRPRDQVTNMDYQPPADQMALGARLVQEYGVQKAQLDNCYVCHR